MSENFKNTTFIYQDEPDLDKAWSEMRKTLDQKLPVKKDTRSRRRFFYYYRIAAMLLLSMGVFLLGTIYNFHDDRQAKHTAQKGENINRTALNNKDEVIGNTTLKDTEVKQLNESGEVIQAADYFKNILSEKKTFSSLFQQNKSSNANKDKYFVTPQLSEKKNNSKSKHGNPLVFENDVNYSIIKTEANFPKRGIIEPEKMLTQLKSPLTLIDTSLKTSDAAKKDEQKKRKRLFSFEIGAYYNIGGSLSAVYPIATMGIPLSKKVFISLGAGLNSQVKIKDFAPKEFTVLNDTVNQTYFTVERKNVRKAAYIDLPVSINYKINNRFTVNAGIQLSVLQNVDIQTEEKAFDFQADLSQQVSPIVFATTSAYTPYQTYAQDYTVLKTNWRFIAGIGYQFKNAGVKFQYQQSFTPNYSLTDFNGVKSEKRLSVFTVGLTYRIR